MTEYTKLLKMVIEEQDTAPPNPEPNSKPSSPIIQEVACQPWLAHRWSIDYPGTGSAWDAIAQKRGSAAS